MKNRAVFQEVLGIFAVGASFFLLASLFSFDLADDPARVYPVQLAANNLGGVTGFTLARTLFEAFGVLGGYAAGLAALALSLSWLSRAEPSRDLVAGLAGGLAVVLALATAERFLAGREVVLIGSIGEDLSGRLAGGYWGTFIEHWLTRRFSTFGLVLAVTFLLAIGSSLASEYLGLHFGSGDAGELPAPIGVAGAGALVSAGAAFSAPIAAPVLAPVATRPRTRSHPPEASAAAPIAPAPEPMPPAPEFAQVESPEPTAEAADKPNGKPSRAGVVMADAVRAVSRAANSVAELSGQWLAKEEGEEDSPQSAPAPSAGSAPGAALTPEPSSEPSPPSPKAESLAELVPAQETQPAPAPAAPYAIPSLDLFKVKETKADEGQRQAVEAKARLIEECLKEFRVEAKVMKTERGPNVTLFALQLGKGIKVQKVTALLDNLALALAAPGGIRLQAPIPRTSWVGLEVPNENQDVVSFREVFEHPGWRRKNLALPLFLGKDTAGRALVADLAKLPHLLIAGATGSGKSVCINSMILSLLMTRTPAEVKLVLIDPKQVELCQFSKVPHLLAPVVTDMRKAGAVLDWAVRKMEERYTWLAQARVRHISDYNRLGKAGLAKRLGFKSEDELEARKIPWKLPYVVVVVDELNDLMMVAQKEVEASIMRLAQKSRAIGIHVILATQRPSVDVITGVIKSNLPSRLAFQVTSKVDSRTILDVQGAEKLLGQGDMLFLAPGRGQPIRAKAVYVSDEELEKVLERIEVGGTAHHEEEVVNLPIPGEKTAKKKKKKKRRRKVEVEEEDEDEDEDEDENASVEVDALYQDAVKAVVTAQRGSVSLLQRKLSIGYGRASRLIDQLADHGVLGSHQGSKARKVLMTLDEL